MQQRPVNKWTCLITTLGSPLVQQLLFFTLTFLFSAMMPRTNANTPGIVNPMANLPACPNAIANPFAACKRQMVKGLVTQRIRCHRFQYKFVITLTTALRDYGVTTTPTTIYTQIQKLKNLADQEAKHERINRR